MQKAATNRIIGYLALGIATIIGAGCIVPSQQAVRTGDVPQQNGTTLRSGPSAPPQGLIKPTIPEERRYAGQPDSEPQPLPAGQPEAGVPPTAAEQEDPNMPLQPGDRARENPEAFPATDPAPRTPATKADQLNAVQLHPRTSKPVPEGGGGRPHEKREWEDQKIKEAAKELSKSFPNVTKIKVCYSVKDDEWWVTLYDKAGAFTELKQYTWNRDQEKLEVFLVLKRIPSTRVQQQLTEEEVGKACDIIEVFNTGSVQ
jgi:hypothetical protein